MPITYFTSSDSLSAKLWAKSLFRDVLAQTWFGKFFGQGTNAIVQIMGESQKNAGDKITFGLLMQLAAVPRTGTQILEGNEEDLTFYSDSVFIDLMRHGVLLDTKMSKQRTGIDLRTEAKSALSNWWSKIIDTYMFRYLTGDTTISFAGNVGTAADSDHQLFAGSKTDESFLTTSDVFTIDLIDKAVYRAKTVSPLVRPVNIEGESYYCVVLHPRQAYDLRTSTSTGGWLDIQKAAMMGGKIKDNPIFTGAIGVYNNCIIYEAPHMPVYNTGSGSGQVARALLLGAQAGVVAFGMGYSAQGFDWAERWEDYIKLGISASLVWGIKKTRFNSKDYGVITMSSAAPTL